MGSADHEETGEEDLDQAIADVYRGPPEEFVSRRDALVKALRAADRRDDANTVKGLRKPTRTAWALNAAAIEDPAAVDRLTAAVAQAIETQSAGGDLRGAFEALRTAVGDLAAAAARAAADQGHPLDRAPLVPVVSAVIGDPDAFDALVSGRLAVIPAAGGLDLLTSLPPTIPRTSRAPATDEPKVDDAAGAEETEAARDARDADAAGAREALQRAEDEAATARERSAAAEQALREAESEAKTAEEQLRLAAQRAQALRSEVQQVRQDAKAAKALERAANESVTRARAELERLTTR